MIHTVKRIWMALSFAFIQLVFAPMAYSIGMSTRFVDVILEYVEVGKIYNLRQLKSVPYTIKNLGNTPIEVEVEVEAPPKPRVKPGYESIPDTNWIKIVPKKFWVDANSVGYADIILEVPNDKQYINKHYHAKLSGNTINKGLFSVSVESDLRFSTGAGPETLKKQRKKQAMMTLDFDITPTDLYVPETIEPGQTFNIKKKSRKKLKVTNRAETPINLKFLSVPWDSQRYPVHGDSIPAPDPSWLKFKSPVVSVKSNTIQDIEPIIEIPDNEEYYGKKYCFLVKTEIVLGVELEFYNKIFVKVKDKNDSQNGSK